MHICITKSTKGDIHTVAVKITGERCSCDFFVNGTAVFSRLYGRFCQLKVRPFSKTGRRFVYKRYYRSKSKNKAVLQVNYGDGWTVVL